MKNIEKEKILNKLVGPSIPVFMVSGYLFLLSISILFIYLLDNGNQFDKFVIKVCFIIIILTPFLITSFIIIRHDYKNSKQEP